MSALGTTIAPEGETGTVTRLQHMPDQVPDNPATIAANTSIETLQNILYENWVWRNTYQIDASMRPGAIIGTIPVHPYECNDYVRHIARMFLTWTGAMKIRTRFMATFQFGGSFRLGFLPPKFTQQQINNLPIQTLTAYPNIDIDPKNTNWIDFQCSDERNILFHWMTDDYTKPENFAGWFVFYVAAPLVLSGEVTQIQLLVEAAGGFHFAQLAPIAEINTGSNAWIGTHINPHHQNGTDDNMAITRPVIYPIGHDRFPVGFIGMLGLGGKKPQDSGVAVLSPRMVDLQTQLHNGTYLYNIEAHGKALDYGSPYMDELFIQNNTVSNILPLNRPIEGVIFKQGNDNVDVKAILEKLDRPWYCMIYGCKTTIEVPNPTGMYLTDCPAYEPDHYKFLVRLPGMIEDSHLVNTLPTESVVVFSGYGGVNFQTTAMAEAMKNYTYQTSTSQLYQYRSENGTPIATLRLHPSGLWTTNRTQAITTLPYGSLVYLQDYPMGSPLPPTPVSARFNRLSRKLTDKIPIPTKEDWEANVFSMI
jgi:hypothetical protein